MASIVYSMKIYPYFVSLNLFICILKANIQNFKAIGFNLSVRDVVVECCGFDALRDTDTFTSLGLPVLVLIYLEQTHKHLGGKALRLLCASRHQTQDYNAQPPFAHLLLAT
jgi:hypothetical protein